MDEVAKREIKDKRERYFKERVKSCSNCGFWVYCINIRGDISGVCYYHHVITGYNNWCTHYKGSCLIEHPNAIMQNFIKRYDIDES